MPRPTSKSFDASWAQLIRATMVTGSQGRPQGDGWKTVGEIAKDLGRSENHIRHYVLEQTHLGSLERTRCKTDGAWRYFYRPTQ